ncbi:MAG: transcription antitermination protein NusB [Lewinellaceae bacterium]|nr:transcription antitermination protein NusB [Lewinella sp.]MCB9279788.1 transcription antitermination protein NusB [Lewinellaceae bacterium]
MLSRRNVRVKVMQVLYSMSRDQELDLNGAFKRYQDIVWKSFELYLFNLILLTKVAEYSRHDASRKQAKLLPSEEDKNFTAKLGDNPLMESLDRHENLQRLYRKHKVEGRIDKDLVRLVYTEFAKTDEYKEYVAKSPNTNEEHLNILLSLYKLCLANEAFCELLEDHFPLWTDDKSLVVGAIKKTVKALPLTDPAYFDEFLPPDETVKDFGEKLLLKVGSSESQLLETIEPVLKNWDAERVAVIDMILIKMAICEFIYFPTIPTKVTLNEFVEISKLYSTDKSKDFINGILDRLLKQLLDDGKIKKEGRGLVDD